MLLTPSAKKVDGGRFTGVREKEKQLDRMLSAVDVIVGSWD